LARRRRGTVLVLSSDRRFPLLVPIVHLTARTSGDGDPFALKCADDATDPSAFTRMHAAFG